MSVEVTTTTAATSLMYNDKTLENNCLAYLEDKLLIDHFLADARLEIGRLQETQEELVDQLYEGKEK